MKIVCLLAAFPLALMAQLEGFKLKNFGVNQSARHGLSSFYNDVVYRVDRLEDPDGLKNPDGTPVYVKQLTIISTICDLDFNTPQGIPILDCKAGPKSGATDTVLVAAIEEAFEAEYAADKKLPTVYPNGALAATAPRLVALDAKSDNRVLSINLSTFATKSSANLPSLRGQTFGLRPTSSGPANEAWVPTFKTGGGTQLAVVNLDSGAIMAQIPIPLTGNGGNPRGVVFSNTGTLALELIDTTVDTGSSALVVVDAAARTIKNTLTIPFATTDILMSPDGYTAYLIGLGPAGTYKVVYYDLLSGTADLAVTIPNADVFFAPYQMHPSGRIYGQNSGRVFVFDPQARKVVSKFSMGLGTGLSALNMQLSQDGSRLYILDSAALRPGGTGNISMLDAITGDSFGSLPIGGVANMFFVAPSLQ